MQKRTWMFGILAILALVSCGRDDEMDKSSEKKLEKAIIESYADLRAAFKLSEDKEKYGRVLKARLNLSSVVLVNEDVGLYVISKEESNYLIALSLHDSERGVKIIAAPLDAEDESVSLRLEREYTVVTESGGLLRFKSKFPPVPGVECVIDLSGRDFGYLYYPSDSILAVEFFYPEKLDSLAARDYRAEATNPEAKPKR